MKQLMDALKGARRIEVLIIAAMVCTLLVLTLNDRGAQPSGNEDEKRMQQILSRIDGAGQVSVMIASDADGVHRGVVVTSSGAEDVRVMLELQRAVRTLTGLDLDQIEVVKSGR